MICNSCGVTNAEDSRFCMGCGATLNAACSACGGAVPPGARFCPSCGHAQGDGVPSSPAEMLKLVTILFADVVGSTARAEQLHPEDIHQQMASYFAAMRPAIENEGGSVERLLGDGILAVFGIPTAHEDDPMRAVNAARNMLARLEAWNAERDSSLHLRIRIGINTGQVMAMGSPGKELLVSDAVNVAARLEQAARPGQIVVGERTARAVRRRYDLKPMPPLVLKGKAEPVRAFLVEAERSVHEERGIPGLVAPLVGRAREMEALHEVFDRTVRSGKPHVVSIVADAGVGKSRLTTEFLGAVEHGAKALVGRCLPYGESVTLWPFAEILRHETGLLDTDPSELAAAKLSRYVATTVTLELAPEHERTVAALGATLGQKHRLLEGLDPRAVFRELIAAWRAVLTSIAATGPLVVVVDDLHWADPNLLDMLDDLASRSEGPILFVCPTRPDLLKEHPDWGSGIRSFTSIALDPLTQGDSKSLIDSLLIDNAIPQEIKDRILNQAEGNPFYLEEIIRRLIDEEVLVRVEGRWEAAPRIEEVVIPDSVQSVILSRIDLLSPEERAVLQRAAVVGRSFWPGALEAIQPEAEVDPLLRTLERRDFVSTRLSSSMAGELEYHFKHVLTRDVAYDSLPKQAKGTAHAAVADWLQGRASVRPDESSELLAFHYWKAHSFTGDDACRRAARANCLIASIEALRRFSLQRAEGLARRAVELSEEGAERVEALEALGDLFYGIYQGDDAWRAYNQAIEELQLVGSRKEIPRLAAKASIIPTRYAASMHEVVRQDEIDPVIELGLSALEEGDSKDRSLLLCSKAFSQAMGYSQRDDSGWRAAEEALRIAEELDDPDLMSTALDAAGAWMLPDGRYGEIHRVESRRVDLVPRLKDIREIGDAYSMASLIATFIGNYRAAYEWATESIERARSLDAGAYRVGLICRVSAAFMTGDWDAALRDQAEIESFDQEDSLALPAPFAMRAYSAATFCHELRGETDITARYLDLLHRYRSQQNLPSNLAAVVAGRLALGARTLAHRGDVEEALTWINLEPSAYLAASYEAACEIVAEAGEWDRAESLLDAVREEAAVKELRALSFYADRLEGRLQLSSGDVEAARRALLCSADGFATLDAPWERAWSELLLAEALVTEGDDAAASLARRAHETFARLGSVTEVARCTAVLDGTRV